MTKKEKTALLWGYGGIGQAIATRLLAEGWQILAAGHLPKLQQQTTEGLAAFYPCAVDNPFAVQTVSINIAQNYPEIDLYIYAAGDIALEPVATMLETTWQRILNANLTGAFYTTQYSLPLLADKAQIFYISAVTEKLQLPGFAAYTASKAGLEAFAEVLRKESRKPVFLLRPGAVDTAFWDKVSLKLPVHHLQATDVAEQLWQIYTQHQNQA